MAIKKSSTRLRLTSIRTQLILGMACLHLVLMLVFIVDPGFSEMKQRGLLYLLTSFVSGFLFVMFISNKARKKIIQNKERYKSIISVSNTGAWEYHGEKGYLWCSPEYFSMLGREQSDYDMSGAKNLQETWINLLHPEDVEKASAHFADYLKNGSIGMYENYFRMQHKNGGWIWIWSRGQTLRHPDGTLTDLTVGTHIDITDRITMEKELKKNQEWNQALVENISDGIIVLDQNRNIIYQSSSVERINGYLLEERANKKAEALVYTEDREKFGVFLDEVYKNEGLSMNGQFRMIHKNGSIIWIEGNMINMLHHESVKGVIVNYRNITAKKKAIEMFKHQFENSPDTILIINRDLTIESINRGRKDGRTPEELVGKSALDVLPEESREASMTAVLSCFEKGTNLEIESPLRGNRWVRSRFVPIAISGTITHIMVIATDITEKKKAENDIRELNESLEQKVIERTRELYEMNQVLNVRNSEITDSIHYAQRIQQAKLPGKKEIHSSLPECFVLFKPKDIVSGDFYFFHKNEQSVFIAAADCTGHGVPGALMSMIGSEILNDALARTSDTSEILKHLNKGIKKSLHQTNSDESTRDGMDIALCSVNTETRIVKYAGANRPIWIVRKDHQTIEEIKAVKKAIGGLTDVNQHFDTHEIKFEKGDTFYIFSDGYADSFGGKKQKKLTTKKLREILLSIQDKSMREQELHLEKFIEDWKAGSEQIDDILVIGVKL